MWTEIEKERERERTRLLWKHIYAHSYIHGSVLNEILKQIKQDWCEQKEFCYESCSSSSISSRTIELGGENLGLQKEKQAVADEDEDEEEVFFILLNSFSLIWLRIGR